MKERRKNMKATIIAIGKCKKNSPEKAIIDEYIKRSGWEVVVKEHDNADREEEAKFLLAAIPAGAKVVALDERGVNMKSLELAALAEKWMLNGCSEICFLIGGADGPTAIFLSSRLAPDLVGAIAVSAYSYMALVPVIQPPIMRLLTTKKERLIKMKSPRAVSKKEKIMFPIIGFLLTAFIVPSGLPLLGMLFFGNLLKESGVTRRLAETARGPLIDTVTILIGLTVGCSTQADKFLQWTSIKIFILGFLSFVIATAAGVLFVKFFNLFLKKGNKINPLIGNAGVSAVPDSARISNNIGLEYDKTNYLLMHAMGPNVAGVIGSAVAAGILLGFLS